MACGRFTSFLTRNLVFGCLVAALFSWQAEAAILTYPGTQPCNATLQACIDGAGTGDTVEIATNTPILEYLNITKSLVLRAAAGFHPVIGGNTGGIITATGSGMTDNFFTFQGITVYDGGITIYQGSTGTLTAKVLDTVLLAAATLSSAGISIADGGTIKVFGNVSFAISGNRITVPAYSGGQTQGVSVSFSNSKNATGTISNNVIVMGENHQGAAIDVYSNGSSLSIDVSGNTISGSNYDAGISVNQQSASGSVTARIADNLVTGQNGHVGSPGAIVAHADEGEMDVAVLNNTVAENMAGISIGGRDDLGALVKARVINNIVAFNAEMGLRIDSDFYSTTNNKYNLVFANKFNSYVPGPGTLTSDPLFVGNGNYRLRPDSPAIDKGTNAPSDGLSPTDLDGLSRVYGVTVDIGAYEYAVMTAPENQQYYTYTAAASPVWSPAPAHAQPLGIGSFEAGGTDIQVSTQIGPVSNPVDVYVGAAYLGFIGQLTPDIFILRPDNTFQHSSAGIVPWKTGVLKVDGALTGNIPASSFTPGFYQLYIAVTPTGKVSSYYIWQTGFFIPFFIQIM